LNEFVESREIAVVQPEFPQEFPDALDRIELRAVRRKEKQGEVWRLQPTPLGVELGMVVSGVVGDDHDPTTRRRARRRRMRRKLQQV